MAAVIAVGALLWYLKVRIDHNIIKKIIIVVPEPDGASKALDRPAGAGGDEGAGMGLGHGSRGHLNKPIVRSLSCQTVGPNTLGSSQIGQPCWSAIYLKCYRVEVYPSLLV